MNTCYKCGTQIQEGTRLCLACKKPPPDYRRQTAKAGAALTFRERQIVRYVMTGDLNREIGKRLGLTEATTKEYVSRICLKTTTRNRTDLAMWGARHLGPEEKKRGGR